MSDDTLHDQGLLGELPNPLILDVQNVMVAPRFESQNLNLMREDEAVAIQANLPKLDCVWNRAEHTLTVKHSSGATSVQYALETGSILFSAGGIIFAQYIIDQEFLLVFTTSLANLARLL